jgi:hypothetical protein
MNEQLRCHVASDSGNAKCGNYATSAIIDGFSEVGYGFAEVCVGFGSHLLLTLHALRPRLTSYGLHSEPHSFRHDIHK